MSQQGGNMGAEDRQLNGEQCRDCGNDVSATLAAGESACPNCGCYVRTPVGEEMNRGLLWVVFFAIFLGTPVVTLLSVRAGALSFLILLTGAFFAGSYLSRLFVRNIAARAAMTFVFGFLLLFVYAGIAFAGCLVALKNHPF